MSSTLDYYDKNAVLYAERTQNAQMNNSRNKFMEMLPVGGRVLDFGCGSGRDTKAFINAGFETEALDGSIELVKLASEYTGIAVKHQLFQEFEDNDKYDGIWACASLLHLPEKELVNVLKRLETALKEDGILYVSFKLGDYCGLRDERFYLDMTPERFRKILDENSELVIELSWISEDTLSRADKVKWFNAILKNIRKNTFTQTNNYGLPEHS